MSELDEVLSGAVDRGDVPFVYAALATPHGVVWQGSAGTAAGRQPAGPDTLFRLFSMTKAIGSLAAMILVDRGQIRLDTEVSSVIPEFGDLLVLTGISGGRPAYREPKRAVTLRHLLTHTSGLAVGTYDAQHAAWQAATGTPGVFSGTMAALRAPLMFDPGSECGYGTGIDWAGLLVERVDGRPIDQFCREEIFGPLRMEHTSFEPDVDRPLVDVVARGHDGVFRPTRFDPPAEPEVYGMGMALYGTGPDYLRFLRMVLNRGELDGRRLLGREVIDAMTTNQVGPLSVPVLRSTKPEVSADVDLFPGVRKTWTAGFLRLESDVAGMRRAGSLGWAGVANTHYWMDPATGVAVVFMTQLLPFFEPRLMTVFAAFERTVYRSLEHDALSRLGEVTARAMEEA
jgi:methyl acetate hydrolase